MESLILVTDATSFVSSHLIKQLQEDGQQVRATVTSLQEEEANLKLLHELCPEAKFKVEVVEADPAKPESWESALKDVQYVLHAVQPAAAQPPAQEGEAPVQPAVEAVLNVFKACVASKSVKRIVLTSSVQAISVSPTVASDKVYTEADWADAEAADPLVKSLILAEKAAWEFVKELTDADKIELCVMNPTTVLGPALLDVQADVVKMLLDRGITGCPRVSYSVVDVRDVALAHSKALTGQEAAGNRYILHGANVWMKDVALTLSKEFKPQGYSIPTLGLPNVAVWGLSLFNKTAKTLLPAVGKQNQYDNTRMKEVLGVTPRDVKETLVDEAQVLIDRGLVKKSKKLRHQAATGAAAEGDAKAEEEGKKEEAGGEDKVKENGEVKEEGKEEAAGDAKTAEGAEEGKGDAGKKEEEEEKKEEKPAEQPSEEGEKKEEESAAAAEAPSAQN